jgi:hypothetical protein
MDINALLQMLQQRFGSGGGGQKAFTGGSPSFREGPFQIPQLDQQQNSPMPTMGAPANPVQGGLGMGTMGGGMGGGGNVMQSIMQMMQRGRGGGMGRQMNLG